MQLAGRLQAIPETLTAAHAAVADASADGADPGQAWQIQKHSCWQCLTGNTHRANCLNLPSVWQLRLLQFQVPQQLRQIQNKKVLDLKHKRAAVRVLKHGLL
eukprot:1158057-Pelagomonas_calceolata.AAC.1